MEFGISWIRFAFLIGLIFQSASAQSVRLRFEKNELGEYITDDVKIGSPPQIVSLRLGNGVECGLSVTDCLWLSPAYIGEDSWSRKTHLFSRSHFDEVLTIDYTKIPVKAVHVTHECNVVAAGELCLSNSLLGPNEHFIVSVDGASEIDTLIVDVVMGPPGLSRQIGHCNVHFGLHISFLEAVSIEIDFTVDGIEMPSSQRDRFLALDWGNHFFHSLTIEYNGSNIEIPAGPIKFTETEVMRIGDAIFGGVDRVVFGSTGPTLVLRRNPAQLPRFKTMRHIPIFHPPVLQVLEGVRTLVWVSVEEPRQPGATFAMLENMQYFPRNGPRLTKFESIGAAFVVNISVRVPGGCVCEAVGTVLSPVKFDFVLNDPRKLNFECILAIKNSIETPHQLEVTCEEISNNDLPVMIPAEAPLGETCCVCRDDFTMPVRPQGCAHVYCHDCLVHMFSGGIRTCAYCRKPIFQLPGRRIFATENSVLFPPVYTPGRARMLVVFFLVLRAICLMPFFKWKHWFHQFVASLIATELFQLPHLLAHAGETYRWKRMLSRSRHDRASYSTYVWTRIAIKLFGWFTS